MAKKAIGIHAERFEGEDSVAGIAEKRPECLQAKHEHRLQMILVYQKRSMYIQGKGRDDPLCVRLQRADDVNRPGYWLCIDPKYWVVTAGAEDVYTGALGDGRLYARRNYKVVSYSLRDAAALKARAEEVLDDTVQEGD